MVNQVTGMWRTAVPLLLAALVSACSDDSDSRPPEPLEPPLPELTYQADIVWTEFGIPHVTADDWGSLGYGAGYSYASENYCVAMREYVRANGESARFLGDDGNINDDLVYKLYNRDERVQSMIDELPDYVVEMLEGYVAGLNRYLRETGVDQLAEGPEGCRGAEWVREVELADAIRLVHKSILRGSAGPLADYIVAAAPPEMVAGAAGSPSYTPEQAVRTLAALDRDAVVDALDLPKGEAIGSNAYAVGEQSSATNSGVLFGNPHFPWQGPERFTMFHLTLGDEYDVMGAALHGLPAPVIGFNRDVAWSHTVSTGRRFTLYELELNAEDPMRYVYNGEALGFETQTVSAEQVADDGTIETVEHTFYFSRFGPVLDLGAISPVLGGWPNALGTLLTYRDANLENLRGLDQWVRMGQAGDMDQFKEALRTIGIPWVNTIAAGRDGNAFYGDVSAIPNVSVNQYQNCIRGPLQMQLTGFGLVTMDGTDPDCEWGVDDDTPDGLFGYDSLPTLETREYGANANDSYWLSNPRQLLEGFSPIIGRERVEQSLRTRATFDQAEERLAGSDGLGESGFDVDNIREMLYGARNHTAELVIDDVVGVCGAVSDWSPYSDDPAAVTEACEVLTDWDTRHLTTSVGAHIFWEFWQAVRNQPGLWVVPFDPADPVYTPRQLNTEDADVTEAVREALAVAVAKLHGAGIPLDRPWGEIQFVEKNGVRYPIHGGSSSMMFSVITSALVPGEGYSAIRHGNSYIQAVTWDESDCPDAYAILTYSQSTDPASDHYADATELYANGGWIDMPYCVSDQEAQELRRESIEE